MQESAGGSVSRDLKEELVALKVVVPRGRRTEECLVSRTLWDFDVRIHF